MLDEGIASEGDCNIVTDHDLAMRLWVNGWQNALLRAETNASFQEQGSGSSHAGPGRARCWVGQWESVGQVVNMRWNDTYPAVWRQVARLNRADPLVGL